jgi:hypothetical protein
VSLQRSKDTGSEDAASGTRIPNSGRQRETLQNRMTPQIDVAIGQRRLLAKIDIRKGSLDKLSAEMDF